MHWWELGIMSIDWGVVLGWINWGLVVNALAAAGSISAAVVALHIATRDRRERQHEHDEAAKAQARLVIVTLYASAQMNVSSPRIALTCKNHSDRPILDVKPDKAWIPGFDEFNNVVGNDETWPVLKPDKGLQLHIRPQRRYGRSGTAHRGQRHTAGIAHRPTTHWRRHIH
ncbi:hypothetical protein [Mycobacteroides abscessus]|uniref:hypothetical protein n=1 Tax=Mycobacteroides abscessus TaxID=36809 RepID=UPI0011C38F3D|nr:hypothetical protein [Mycobacteroides abscessus]